MGNKVQAMAPFSNRKPSNFLSQQKLQNPPTCYNNLSKLQTIPVHGHIIRHSARVCGVFFLINLGPFAIDIN